MTEQKIAIKVNLDEFGRITLPAKLRHQLGWSKGDKLIVSKSTDGSLRVASIASQINKLRGVFKKQGGRSLAAELIEERRLGSADR